MVYTQFNQVAFIGVLYLLASFVHVFSGLDGHLHVHQNACSVHKDQRRSVVCLLVCLVCVFEGLFVLTHALIGDCHIVEEVEVGFRAHLFCYFELF